jgi:NAD(P)-dependent dehydrogenase (short-subunit alcohol dehydrogenase family)
VEATANEIRAELKRAGKKNADGLVYGLKCDIRDPQQVANMVQATLAKYKKIDFLVNNGTAPRRWGSLPALRKVLNTPSLLVCVYSWRSVPRVRIGSEAQGLGGRRAHQPVRSISHSELCGEALTRVSLTGSGTARLL